MNGDLSPRELIRRLLAANYKVVKENVKSPVGPVPRGSTVFTDHNGKRAVWIHGRLYQHQDNNNGDDE